MRILTTIITSTFFMILSCCCSNTNKLNDDEKELAFVYCQLVRLETLTNLDEQTRLDSARAILNSCQLTQPKYDSLISHMNSQPKKWAQFYHAVQKQLTVVDSPQNK